VLLDVKETCNGAWPPKKQSREEKAQSGEAQTRGANISVRAWSGHGRPKACSQEEGWVAPLNISTGTIFDSLVHELRRRDQRSSGYVKDAPAWRLLLPSCGWTTTSARRLWAKARANAIAPCWN
jgi:hypothetical protein